MEENNEELDTTVWNMAPNQSEHIILDKVDGIGVFVGFW